MTSKAAAKLLAEEGSVATMAPEGSAERVRHDEDELLHPEPSSLIAKGHAFCDPAPDMPPTPTDECADCGFSRSDHVDAFAEPPTEGAIRVTDYDADGEAIDREVGPTASAQAEMPGTPPMGIWGDYQGRRVTHVSLGFGGGPDAPASLAGKLSLGERVYLSIGATVVSNGYKNDKQTRLPYGTAALHVESVSVAGDLLIVRDEDEGDDDVAFERLELLDELAARAAQFLKDIETPDGITDALQDAADQLIQDLAAALDPLPFEEDEGDNSADKDSADHSLSEPESMLSSALAEALA